MGSNKMEPQSSAKRKLGTAQIKKKKQKQGEESIYPSADPCVVRFQKWLVENGAQMSGVRIDGCAGDVQPECLHRDRKPSRCKGVDSSIMQQTVYIILHRAS